MATMANQVHAAASPDSFYASSSVDPLILPPCDYNYWPPDRGWWSSAAIIASHESRVPVRPEHGERVCAPAGDHGIVPGGAEGAEERHIGVGHGLRGVELPAEAVEGKAAGQRGR